MTLPGLRGLPASYLLSLFLGTYSYNECIYSYNELGYVGYTNKPHLPCSLSGLSVNKAGVKIITVQLLLNTLTPGLKTH